MLPILKSFYPCNKTMFINQSPAVLSNKSNGQVGTFFGSIQNYFKEFGNDSINLTKIHFSGFNKQNKKTIYKALGLIGLISLGAAAVGSFYRKESLEIQPTNLNEKDYNVIPVAQNVNEIVSDKWDNVFQLNEINEKKQFHYTSIDLKPCYDTKENTNLTTAKDNVSQIALETKDENSQINSISSNSQMQETHEESGLFSSIIQGAFKVATVTINNPILILPLVYLGIAKTRRVYMERGQKKLREEIIKLVPPYRTAVISSLTEKLKKDETKQTNDSLIAFEEKHPKHKIFGPLVTKMKNDIEQIVGIVKILKNKKTKEYAYQRKNDNTLLPFTLECQNDGTIYIHLKSKKVFQNQPIGNGAEKKVYLAVKDNGEIVAASVIKLIDAFECERLASVLFKGSQYIVQGYHTIAYYGKDQKIKYGMITEYCNGITNHEFFNKLSLIETWAFVLKVFEGVEYMHHKGYSHCDLKGANILYKEINDKYEPKINDFGCMKLLNQNLPFGGLLTPETTVNQEIVINESIDIWQLGRYVAIEILGLNFNLSSHNAQFADIRNWVENDILPANSDLKEEMEPFVPVIKKMLAQNPEERIPLGEAKREIQDLVNILKANAMANHDLPSEANPDENHRLPETESIKLEEHNCDNVSISASKKSNDQTLEGDGKKLNVVTYGSSEDKGITSDVLPLNILVI